MNSKQSLAQNIPQEPISPPTTDSSGLIEQVISRLKSVYDPEIPVNIVDLGLIYGVAETAPGEIVVTMTLTAPNCPAAQFMPEEIETKLKGISGVKSVRLDIVWDPPWDPSRMSEAARLELGMF